MNGVIGFTLFTTGTTVVLYSIIPASAWVGIAILAVGILAIFESQKEKIARSGLKPYIPTWVNQYLTRHDLIDHMVLRIRENNTVQKFIRLVLIKVMDLSREEIVEVLAGIWPRFRDLSSHDGSLIEFTPDWFRRLYAGNLDKRTIDSRPHSGHYVTPELPCSPLDSVDDLDDFSPSSVATRHVIEDALSAPQRYDLYPLLMWIAEKRVRRGVSSAGPIMGRIFKQAVLPSIITAMIWRKFPRSQKPLSRLFALILLVYVVSITRGLPASCETVFKLLNLSYRRKNRLRRTTPTSGSLSAVMYALLEPLIPQINTTSVLTQHKNFVPCSPAPSQASTMEPALEHR